MSEVDKIIASFLNTHNASGNQSNNNFTGITVGVVIDTDDPLQQGRLRIFCPTLNDDPKQLQYIPWSAYASPLLGSVNSSSYTRGSNIGPATSDGALHYGFWSIPDLGAHVLVSCIDGDYRRRFWFACLPQHQETHTLHSGRWKWDGGTVDGPLTSSGSPMEPLYTNAGEAFENKKDSPEWKSRIADYQAAAVRDDTEQVPNSKKSSYVDQTNKKIRENEPDAWTHPALGAHGYDWSSYKKMGAILAPKSHGWVSPGMHMIVLDDRPFNNRIKIRSTSGHQVLLDDANERIYIATAKGKNWIELDNNGNIDMFSENRVSINCKSDINFSTEETFRVHAKKGIHMFSGSKEGQDPLDEKPADGQIRIHAIDDIHVITEKNYRHLSVEDTLIEIGGKKCETIGESMFLQVQEEINILTNTGDYNLTVSGNLNEFTQGDVRKYALGSMRNMADGDAQMHSFGGKMDIGAQKTIDVKSIGEDIVIESVGKNSDSSGTVYVKAPESIHSVSNNGISSLTTKSIKSKSAESIDYEIDENIQSPEPPEDVEIPEECDIGDTVSTEGYTGAALAARLAYNAGFRGQDLIIATAIAGGESGYNQSAQNNADGRPTKWGPSVGMWQVRTLQNPEQWTGLDRQRDPNIVGGPSNAQNNANFAYSVYQRSGFREWGAYTNNSYKQHLSAAESAVTNLCGGMMAMSYAEHQFNNIFALSDPGACAASMESSCSPDFSISANTSFSLNVDSMNIQSKLDTQFASLATGVKTKLAEGIVATIDENATRLNELQAKTLSFMNIIGNAAGSLSGLISMVSEAQSFIANFSAEAALLEALGISFPFSSPLSIADFVPEFPFDQLLGDICKFKVPEFEYDINATFQIKGFEACETESDIDVGLLTSQITIR